MPYAKAAASSLAIILCHPLLVSHALAIGNTDQGDGLIVLGGLGYPVATVSSASSCNSLPATPDATPGIQNAINAAAISGGGVVYVPAGLYCVKTHLTINQNVVLRGIFEAPPTKGATTTPSFGSILLAIENANNASGTSFITMQQNSIFEGFTIYYPDQVLPATPTWTPIAYPFAVTGNNDVTVRNVALWNAYQGIDLTTAYTHHHRIFGVLGTPIKTGIKVTNAYDTSVISDIHFWPYWGFSTPVVQEWIRRNGVAFDFGRVDGEQVSNIFAWGHSIGIRFYYDAAAYGGATAQLSNVYLDDVGVGIDLKGTYITGVQMSNLIIGVTNDTTQPQYGVWNELGSGEASFLNISNAQIIGHPKSAIQWDGNGHIAVSGSRFGAFSAGVPNVVINRGSAMIQNNSFYGAIAGTPAISIATAAGRVLFTGNSLFGSTIVNSGSFTTTGLNGP